MKGATPHHGVARSHLSPSCPLQGVLQGEEPQRSHEESRRAGEEGRGSEAEGEGSCSCRRSAPADTEGRERRGRKGLRFCWTLSRPPPAPCTREPLEGARREGHVDFALQNKSDNEK